MLHALWHGVESRAVSCALWSQTIVEPRRSTGKSVIVTGVSFESPCPGFQNLGRWVFGPRGGRKGTISTAAHLSGTGGASKLLLRRADEDACGTFLLAA
jgi:hypothetical protein